MTDRAMLDWQYRSLLGELQQVQLHASDPTCPCSMASINEWCIPKHLLNVATLAGETAAMDPENTALLYELQEAATEQHIAARAAICGHQEPEDLVTWARQWRKHIEPHYYVCRIPLGAGDGDLEACELLLPQDIYGLWFKSQGEVLLSWEPTARSRKMEEVIDRLKEGVAALIHSDAFRTYLDTMGRFHHYSIGNCLLISIQRPGATRVAGYRRWQELGRQVNKGERGIAILAPCMPAPPRADIDIEGEDEEESGEHFVVPSKPIYFRVVYVFDISQTAGEDLPEWTVPILEGDEDALRACLETYAAGVQISIDRSPAGPGYPPSTMGYYAPDERRIWIRPDVPGAQQVKTLLHELAHYEAGHTVGGADAETIAESVAYVIGAHYGFDTGVRSFPYVALWAENEATLRHNLETIRALASKMIDRLDVIPRCELHSDISPDEPLWCPGIVRANRELGAISKGLGRARSRIASFQKDLENAIGICQGQAVMFHNEPAPVLDPYGSRCRDPETGLWVSSSGCGFAPAGITTTAMGADGLTHYDFEFRIVDIGDLIVSHDPYTYEPNAAYPQELQPRLRDRAATRLQVERIAANLEPDSVITDFHVLDRGAPIVGPDMVVEAGNGRVMALMLAISEHPDNYDRYIERLGERIRDYGMRLSDVKAVQHPVLVRVRVSDVDRVAFAQEANAAATIAPSAIENARTDAARISVGMLQELIVGEAESLEDALRSPRNRVFTQRFLNTLSPEAQASLVDAYGYLNRDGVHRMVMAVFVSAFRGDAGIRLAEKAFESLDQDVRAVINGIARALGALAQAEALALSGGRDPELSIGEDLAQAVTVYSAIKRTPGLTLEMYLAQGQLFERELDDFQVQLIKTIDEHRRSPKRIASIITAYTNAVIAEPPPSQTSLIPIGRPAKAELWEAAASHAEPQAALFQPPEHGFAICVSADGALVKGTEAIGTADAVVVPIECPDGTYPVGFWHTHPGGDLTPSQADIEACRMEGFNILCVHSPEDKVTACYDIKGEDGLG